MIFFFFFYSQINLHLPTDTAEPIGVLVAESLVHVYSISFMQIDKIRS